MARIDEMFSRLVIALARTVGVGVEPDPPTCEHCALTGCPFHPSTNPDRVNEITQIAPGEFVIVLVPTRVNDRDPD